MRLQGKLLLLLVPLVVVSLVGIGSVAYQQLRGNVERSHLQRMETLLDQIDQQVKAKIRTAAANTELFAANFLLEKYALIEDEAERYQLLHRPLLRMFASYQQAYPDYYEIRFLLPDGYEAARRVVGDVPNRTEMEDRDPLLSALAASGDAVFSEIRHNPDNGEVALYAGKALRLRDPSVDPLVAAPLLRGYLVITVRLSELEQQIRSRPLGDSGMLLVSDANGNILYHDHAEHDEASSGSSAREHALNKADKTTLRSALHRPVSTDFSLIGERAHLRARTLHTGLHLFGAMPQRAVDGATAALRNTVAVITVATIAAFIGLLFGGLRRLVLRPLQRLEAVAHEIGHGKLDVQLSSTGNDEMASLARSFAGMARSLVESNAQVRFLADHDSLTGLPNRRLFQEYLERTIAHAQRARDGLALLFLDVDEFKNVNDTLGHHAGDQLLEQFAECLLGVVRTADVVARNVDSPGEMVARLGGDEFIVLLPGLADYAVASRIAERILAQLRKPFVINRQRFFVGASIGITLYPHDGRNVADLIKHADLAMYHAKRLGKNNYQFFSHDMNEAAVRRMQVERRLRQALERKEFLLHFQPVLELGSGRIVGAEALLRWRDADTGRLVPPDEFIPIAEDSGLILPLGEWVLHEACKIAKGWRDRGLPPIKVGVNASALQVERGELSRKVRAALERTGLDPQSLEVELTETVIMSSTSLVEADLVALRVLGVSVALDDFGVGYSSLNYLRRFSIDKLKIDRSFVQGCPDIPSQGSIVTAIIAMAQALGHVVVGEGIETQDELAFLKDQHCDLGQGYLFSRPLPAAEFEALLRKDQAAWTPDLPGVGCA